MNCTTGNSENLAISSLLLYLKTEMHVCDSRADPVVQEHERTEIERETLYQNENLDKKESLLFISLETNILLYYFE